MITLVAILALALQDPPRPLNPPPPPRPTTVRPSRERDGQDSPEARERMIKELERRAEAIQDEIDKLPDGSPERAGKADQITRIQTEIRRLRDGGGRPGERLEPGRPRSRSEFPDAPRPPDGRDGSPRLRPLENPDQVREWLEKNEPEMFQRLVRAQEEGRRPEALQILSDAQPRMEMNKRDPEGYKRIVETQKLERESMDLAEKARRAPAEERGAMSKQMAEVLSKLFDLREENRGNEVTELRKRVEALDKELANRKANKSKIVERRRRELMGERGELDW